MVLFIVIIFNDSITELCNSPFSLLLVNSRMVFILQAVSFSYYLPPWEHNASELKFLFSLFLWPSFAGHPSLNRDWNVCLPLSLLLSFHRLLAHSNHKLSVRRILFDEHGEEGKEGKEGREASKWQTTRTESKQATDADTEKEKTDMQRHRKKHLAVNKISSHSVLSQ